MVTLGLAMWRGVDEGSAVTAERPPWWEVSVEACPRKSMITVISSSHPAVTQDQVRVSIDLSMSPLSLLVMTDTTAVTAATQSVVVEAPRAGVIAVPENPQATAIADGVIVGVVVAADAVPPHGRRCNNNLMSSATKQNHSIAYKRTTTTNSRTDRRGFSVQIVGSSLLECIFAASRRRRAGRRWVRSAGGDDGAAGGGGVACVASCASRARAAAALGPRNEGVVCVVDASAARGSTGQSAPFSTSWCG
ncbi:Protein of unknown function [Gryllus bimaculatus]|nr:Protein of unknown function [Gryllus bimaculatus]